MRSMKSLHERLRPVALVAALVGGACQPSAAPAPTPQAGATTPRLVPAPASMTLTGGAPFDLARTSTIVADASNPEVTAIAQTLASLIRRPTEFPMAVGTTSARGAIVLRLAGDPSLGDEGYRLNVSPDSMPIAMMPPLRTFAKSDNAVFLTVPCWVQKKM